MLLIYMSTSCLSYISYYLVCGVLNIPYACLSIQGGPTNPWMLYRVATRKSMYISFLLPLFFQGTSADILQLNYHSLSNTIQWTVNNKKRNDVFIHARQSKPFKTLCTLASQCVWKTWQTMLKYSALHAACHSQELCVLCDMTGWLRRAQREK